MDLERRVVCVKQHFRLVVVRQKNFELQGSWLVGKRPGSVGISSGTRVAMR
jgi:hypothetical protein